MRQFFNKSIVSILIFYVVWLFLLPYMITKAIPSVCENLSHNTPFNVVIKNPKIKLNIIPKLIFKADKLEIETKSKNQQISLNNIYLDLRILPLLSGNVHLNKAYSSDVKISSNLKKQLTLDKDFFKKADSIKFHCNELKLDKIELAVYQPNFKNPAVYEGKDIYFNKNQRYIKFNLNSKINIENEVSKIFANAYLPQNNDINKSLLNIKISNLNIAPICDYLKNYLPEDFKNARGIINVDVDNNHLNIQLNNCAFLMNDTPKSIIFPEKFNIISDFNITRKRIKIENVDIKSKRININLSGRISDYIDKPLPTYDINVRINPSKLEDIIEFLPSIKTEDIDVYKLKTYKFYGDIIGNLSIKGKNLEPSVNGNIFINNGVLTKPIQNASGATVKLKFIGKYLNFDVFVPAGNSENVRVKGGVELYNVKYSDMRIWSTKNVDLKTAEEKVVPIHEILNFVIGPVPIMDIKGVGNIDITVKGNRKNPHVWGALNFRNVTTFFKEIPNMIMHDSDAVLNFDDENAVFNLKQGKIDGKEVSINGTCNLSGKFDFDVNVNNQELSYLYKSIKTSTIIDELKNMIPDFEHLSGLINLKAKVYGNIKDIEYIKYNDNFFVKGAIELLGNNLKMQGVQINDTKGTITFDPTSAQAKITSKLGQHSFNANFKSKDNFVDLYADFPRLNINDLFSAYPDFPKDMGNVFVSSIIKYKGKFDKIEYDKVDFSAQILGIGKNNKLKISNGNISLKNNRLKISDIKGSVDGTQSVFDINMNIDNFSNNPYISGKIKLKDFELKLFNIFNEYSFIPQDLKNQLKQIKFTKGKINLNANISRNNLYASTNLGGIELIFIPLNLPVKIVNGSVYAKGNFIGINKINLLTEDGMPILIDGHIDNFFTKPKTNIYINSKPRQEFIDKYINNNNIYPLKIKGDIVYNVRIKGEQDNYNLSSEVNIGKDSSVYYLGATVGDIENEIILNLDTQVIKNNILKIKEFSYDKLIASQGTRKTRLNMLKANGGVELLKDDLIFNDLRIKTHNPTDARIFNILFKKPNIKQGQFASDLKCNGRLSNPKLAGNFKIFETNIPFLDTTLKSINFNFKEKTIDITSFGEVLGNDIKLKGTLRNKLTPPYYIENAYVYTKLVDINRIIDTMKMSQLDEARSVESGGNIDLSDAVIKNLTLNADNIKIRNLVAQNVDAQISLNEKKDFNINNFKFNIANGYLNGNYTFNLKNNDTKLKLNAQNIDANDITVALFDLNNQLYGDLTGNMNLSCSGIDFNKCMETLNGDIIFNVSDGRMPKLGSLEYLLKAGNLIKGGFTGLSINSVIDIITPLKTGNFSNIYGDINIKNGVAENIEISTKGKDLSLFIFGKYYFADSVANMEVLGLLSKKISTMFGPLGNVSLNTLFNTIPGVDLTENTVVINNINKIPGIEISDKSFRKFIAEIKGNINGDKYVSSFKWIN